MNTTSPPPKTVAAKPVRKSVKNVGAEKFLAESGDKLPSEMRDEVNEALGELRSALGGQDIDKIKSAHEKLMEVSQKAGSTLYAQSQAATGGAGAESGEGAPAGAGASGATAADDDVVDAEVIDEGDAK